MTYSLLRNAESARKVKNGVQFQIRAACSESHVPCFQERVDTGTPLFCPVVVASKGSSLNHSA
jgi:hypothetical protein